MFRTAPRWLQALLVGQAISAAGALAWLYLTLYLVQADGLTLVAAGGVTAVYGLGTIAGNLGGGWVGDRVGLRVALAGALLGWGTCCAAFPLAPRPGLLPLAVLAGLLGGATRPLMGALVATALPAERRREGISLYRAANNLGTVLGPPLGGLLAVRHFGLVFVVDAVTSLVLLAVVLRWCPAPVRAAADPAAPTSVLRALRAEPQVLRLLLSVLAVDTTYRLLYTVVPLFLRDEGARPLAYGLTVSLNCLVIVAVEPRLARRLTSRPAVPVIAVGYVAVGAGWLLLGAAPAVLTVFVAVLVITAGEMLYKPTATALAVDLAPSGMTGRFQSLYAAASLGGLLLSPLLGVAAYEAAPALVWPAAGVVALAAAGALHLSRSDRGSEQRAVSAPGA